MKHFLTLLIFLSAGAFAQKDPELKIETAFEGYTLTHVVFNSTFIPAKIATQYGITRGAYNSILNVALIPKGKIGGVAMQLSGTVTNLMQQQKTLNFKEIREDDVVYYIAPVRIAGEEKLRFQLRARPEDSEDLFEARFTQTVYQSN